MTATYRPYSEVLALLDALDMPACPTCGRKLSAAGAPCVPCENGAPSAYGARSQVSTETVYWVDQYRCLDRLVRDYFQGAASAQQLRAAVGLGEAG